MYLYMYICVYGCVRPSFLSPSPIPVYMLWVSLCLCVYVCLSVRVWVFLCLSLCLRVYGCVHLSFLHPDPHPCVHVMCISLCFLPLSSSLSIFAQVRNNSTKEIKEITLGNVEELLGASSEVQLNDLDVLNMMLYVKDYYNVSDSAYHKMTQICKQLPRHYKIKE